MSDRSKEGELPPRGFALLTPEERRALGSKGGRTAHERGTANRFTPEAASRAGKIPHAKGTAHHWTSEDAREAGRKGGLAARKVRGRRQTNKQQAERTSETGETGSAPENVEPAFEHRPLTSRIQRFDPSPPQEVWVHADGSVVASYANGDRLARFESFSDFLRRHGLRRARDAPN